MSFYDIEAQNSSKRENDPRSGQNLRDSAEGLLIELERQLKNLDREYRKVGTKADSTDIRNSIETGLIPNCNSIRDKIEEQTWNNVGHIVKGSKLYNDFQMLKNELQRFERDYAEKKLKNPIRKSRNDPNSLSKAVRRDPESHYVSIQVDEQTPLLQEETQESASLSFPKQQRQSQIQVDSVDQDELDFNTIIQRERSQQINKIHSAVQEVNAIFHQLGSLVTEQGEQVDTIDENIGNLSNNMQKANEQLNKADEHQRKRNRCGLATLVIMVIVVLVIVLAVLS